mmetsp:Transcript_22018/g.52172  ORF Transcript_22018/g.52172 Transcript_22018/m.52172 type:complete len:216 (-) Transcript_22018:555-1202(-)
MAVARCEIILLSLPEKKNLFRFQRRQVAFFCVAKFDLHTQVQRQAKVSWSNSICESVRSQKWCIFIRDTRQLKVCSPLLVGSLEVEVSVRDSVCNSNVPRRRLSVQLHLQLLDHLLLRLQKLHSSLLLLCTLHLNLTSLLSALCQTVHDRLKSCTFTGEVPTAIGLTSIANLIPCRALGFSNKVRIGLQHGFVFRCSATGSLRRGSVILEGLFSQ